MFMRAGCSPQSQLRLGLGITFPFRGRTPLSQRLQLACGPADPVHTDLPWPAPSSPLAEAVPLVYLRSRANTLAAKDPGVVRFHILVNSLLQELKTSMHLLPA